MSGVTRRDFAGAVGAAAAMSFISIRTISGEACRPGVAVFDSRIAESRRFAKGAARDGLATFDLAGQDDVHWKGARMHLVAMAAGGVTGMTRWSDWVNLRALFGERGLRVASEQHLDGSVFAWAMRPQTAKRSRGLT